MRRINIPILHGFRAADTGCRPPALDLAAARRYCAGIEYLAREARIAPDPRVVVDALRTITFQAENILRLGVRPVVHAPTRIPSWPELIMWLTRNFIGRRPGAAGRITGLTHVAGPLKKVLEQKGIFVNRSARTTKGHATRQTLSPPPAQQAEGGKDGLFRLTAKGLFWDEIFVCSRLDVTAYARSVDSDNWGRMLEWPDPDGRDHSWCMPSELLAGEGKDILARLLSEGLIINHSKRDKILSYLQSERPQLRLILVPRLGWNGQTFVFPDASIPEGTEGVVYQAQTGVEHRYYVRGTLKDWRETIGRLCAGNSRLVFSVSAAFAATLLRPLGLEGGGFHLVGTTSTGKTTTQNVAGSVCGAGAQGQRFKRSWHNTQNGTEAMAEAHNDCLLLLDELSEVDPKVADLIVYMLANGTSGKGRATQSMTGTPSLTAFTVPLDR